MTKTDTALISNKDIKKVALWIMGTMCLCIIGMIGWYVRSVDQRIGSIDARCIVIEKNIRTLLKESKAEDTTLTSLEDDD